MMPRLIAATLAMVFAMPLGAQLAPPGDSAAAFIAQARAGTARYRDQNVAIAEGYRALGPDAPGMGKHWIHPGLVLAGRFDPAHPQVLNYIMVGGRAVLAGVAFAIPTADGTIPAAPAPRDAWHFHGRSVDEESFITDHRQGPSTDDTTGTRVAVLHAWIWEANPAGIFTPDNWALPFVRRGAAPPPSPSREAALALSLASQDGRTFLRRLLSPDARPGLDGAGEEIGRWLERRASGPFGPTDLAWLESRWRPFGAPLTDRRVSGGGGRKLLSFLPPDTLSTVPTTTFDSLQNSG